MRNSLLGFYFALFSTLFLTQPLDAKDAVFIGTGSGTFTNSTRWQDGYVPQPGDTAVLLPINDSNLQIPDDFEVSLASILVNTNNAYLYVAFDYATTTLVAPALIAVSNGTLAIRYSVLAGSAGLNFVSQKGTLELRTNNVFTGPVSIQGGLVLLGYDDSLGAVPLTFDPAAILVDGGMLGNFAEALTLAPTRGITTGPGGVYFSAKADPNTPLAPCFAIAPPITGEGSVTIVRQTSRVMFSNPANDYAGDTIFGAVTPNGYYYGLNTAFSALTLGADEVIPDTSRLVFPNGHDGLFDLNGHAETVKGIVASNSVFAIANTNPDAAGVLHTPIPEAAMNASIGAGATLDLTGPGTARFNGTLHAAYAPSSGTLLLSEGVLAFSDPARLGAITLALNGGNLAIEAHQPGLAEYRSSLSGGRVDTNALDMAFMGVFKAPRWANAEIPNVNAFGNTTQYLYEGEWYVPADATYSFGKGFDDGACLIIDGQTLIYDYVLTAIVVKKNVHLSAGWHSIRLYVSNASGSVGPLAANGFVSGILYDPTNGNITNGLGMAENAYPFADPGDGSVLRTLAVPATMTAQARLEIKSDATLDRAAAPSKALVWASDIVSAPNVTLTVSGGSEPFTVGSPARPAVFEANVSDANSVRFQDKVWVKTLPSPLVYGANADLGVGVPGILGTGAQSLTDYSLRIPSTEALGDPALAPVTVNTGRSLTFDSTTELNSYLIDDPDRAFTASNAVILAGGTLAFDGPGTVTLDAPVSGSGKLIKFGSGTAVLTQPATFSGSVTVSNGTLTVLDNAALGNTANPVALIDGTLDLSALDLTAFSHALTLSPESAVVFPETPLTLSGVLSGKLTKTGPAALTLAGSAPNASLDLYVAEGAVTLNNTPGPAIRNLLGVDTHASVTLGNAGQISGSVCLSGGTLDLAGHDVDVKNLRAYVPSQITNSVFGITKLTVGTDNTDGCLIGALAPNVAFEKQGTNTFILAAVPGTSAPSSVNVASGTLVLGNAPSFIRLTILKTRTAGLKPRIGEIILTRNGYPRTYRTDVTTTASSSQSPHNSGAAVDGTTSGFWLANDTESPFVAISLKEPTVFDGYRLYNGTNVIDKASEENDPVSWQLEISSDNTNWLLVDVVENAVLYSTNPGIKIYDRNINPAAWPSIAFDATTPVSVVAGATLQAASPTFPVGTLSGAGTFEFLRGASTTLGDVTTFTGTYMGAGEMVINGSVPLNIPGSAVPSALSGRLYGTDTVTFPPDFTTVRNATTPAAAVLGTSGLDGRFAGRLAEAAAPLGLTKVGAGKTTLVDSGSTYTGDTVIEAGTLAINAVAHKFRYVKFNVTAAQNDGKDSSGFEMAYAEFQLLLNGQPVAWPSGTTATAPNTNMPTHAENVPYNAIDGNLNNRWLTGPLQALTIDTQSGVYFDSYRFYESGKTSADYGRCPKTWTVEGSDDGVNWAVVDSQAKIPTPTWVSGTGALVGTFALRSSPRAWLPAQFRVETPVTNQFLSAVTASNFCFQVLGVRNETNKVNYGTTGFSITELTLLRNNEVVPWPAGTTAWSPAPGFNSAYGNPANLVNNNEVATRDNRFYSSLILNHVIITTPTNLIFDAYRWITNEGQDTRDPNHWRLMVMPAQSGTTAYLVDEQISYPTPSERGARVGPFPIRQHAGFSAIDAIPDTSRVRIAQGASLEIGPSAIETIGPLSGTGTVSLATGASLGINLFADATFDGALSGHGPLALAGEHTQFFTLVNTIPGDFAVDFRGGRFGGTLHIGGALAVTGDVRYGWSGGMELPYHRTLFTYNSIDPDSRAALIAGAASIAVPSGVKVKVRVTDTSAALSISVQGTILFVR